MPKRKHDLGDYEIREGDDGRQGIYLRDYNVRLATFTANSAHLRKLLTAIFEREHRNAQR